jgi:predicted acetyltransferase
VIEHWTTVDLRGLARAQVHRDRRQPARDALWSPNKHASARTSRAHPYHGRPRPHAGAPLYDFSELLGLEIGDDGLFSSSQPKGYWTERRYQSFLIHAGGRLAGFTIVDSQSRITGEPLWDMNQFFVLRRHRLVGVGAGAAVAVFDSFPGRWEVREVTRNTPAQTFWRKVIGRYTDGRFEEVALDNATWQGPVQRFESCGR